MSSNLRQARPLQILRSDYRFAILFAVLIIFFLMGPIVELMNFRQGLARTVFTATFAVMMVAAVLAISRSKRLLMIAVLLAVPTFVADIFRAWFGTRISFLVDHTISMLFLGFIIVVILGYLFTQDRVTADLIFASLCVYLLLGTLWAVAYSTLVLLDPHAFSYPLMSDSSADLRFGTEATTAAFYFSLVTMTTLGYGDIVPMSSGAKILASLQAVLGQLYLAVLVARLVGLHISQSRQESANESGASSRDT